MYINLILKVISCDLLGYILCCITLYILSDICTHGYSIPSIMRYVPSLLYTVCYIRLYTLYIMCIHKWGSMLLYHTLLKVYTYDTHYMCLNA